MPKGIIRTMQTNNDIKKESERITEMLSIKNVVITSGIICIACGIAGMFFVSPLKWWGGIIFGYAINLLCFRLMYLNIESSISKNPKVSKFSAFGGYSARYVIKGFALYTSFISKYLSVGSCIAGLLSLSAAIHVLNILNIQLAKSKERE